jgi:ribosomal protein L10
VVAVVVAVVVAAYYEFGMLDAVAVAVAVAVVEQKGCIPSVEVTASAGMAGLEAPAGTEVVDVDYIVPSAVGSALLIRKSL